MAPEEVATATGGLGRRRVLVFPLPYQGHINPMFQLAGLLHARGFTVTVFHSSFNAPVSSHHPAYEFIPVPDCMPPGSPDTLAATVEHIFAVNRYCEAPFQERLAALLEAPCARDDVACLVADVHLLTLMDVARQQRVPTLALHTGSAACFRNFVENPMLSDRGYPPAQESQLLSKLRSRAVEAVTTSAGFILNTFDALEEADLATTRQELTAVPVPVFVIGPLHKIFPASSSSLLPPNRTCLDWLDSQPPASVLYISFGSLATLSGADIVEAAWGVANSGQPFLWALRPDLLSGPARAVLPDGFDAATHSRGMVVSWAPQEEVLAHAAVGVFFTHCGWNSTLEAVCGGVPMLCRPCFGDQMGNAKQVERVWSAGIALDGGRLERGEVEAAVRKLMRGKEGEKMRELKSRAATAVAEGGSSRLSVDKLVNHIMSL